MTKPKSKATVKVLFDNHQPITIERDFPYGAVEAIGELWAIVDDIAAMVPNGRVTSVNTCVIEAENTPLAPPPSINPINPNDVLYPTRRIPSYPLPEPDWNSIIVTD